MNAKDHLPPQQVLEQISDLHPILYRAIEHGTEKARYYFEAENRPINPVLFNDIVRYQVLEFLRNDEYRDLDYQLRPVPNNGVYLEARRLRIRVWKADDGEIPAPGRSSARQSFFYQGNLFSAAMPKNLAVIWDINSNYVLEKVFLACPSGDEDVNPWKAGQSLWEVDIPHPATVLTAEPQFAALPEDDDDFVVTKRATATAIAND